MRETRGSYSSRGYCVTRATAVETGAGEQPAAESRDRLAPRLDDSRAGATAGSGRAGTSLVQRRQAARSCGPTKTPTSTAHSLGDLAPAGVPRGCSTVPLRRTPSGSDDGPGSVSDREGPHQSRLADEVPAPGASACRAAESAVCAPSVGDSRAGSIVGQGRGQFGGGHVGME